MVMNISICKIVIDSLVPDQRANPCIIEKANQKMNVDSFFNITPTTASNLKTRSYITTHIINIMNLTHIT